MSDLLILARLLTAQAAEFTSREKRFFFVFATSRPSSVFHIKKQKKK